MSCQWQMGMLVMRECGLPAAAGCALCGRQICPAHTMMGQNGPACPGCASHTAGYEENEDTEIAGARDQYYSQYGGAAQFGSQGYFSGGDSASMAQRGIPQKPLQQRQYDDKET
jgi:hypothetical protein